MKTNKTKPGLAKYFSKYKLGVFIYILVMLLASACTIAITIVTAQVIELITETYYRRAIIFSIIVLILTVGRRVLYFLSDWIYQTYSNKIMSNLNFDLANQAFKLNSKTFTDHDTGTFVLRIVNDPELVVSKFAALVDVFADMISAIVMFIYILTLNSWIALVFIICFIVGMILERIRVKIRRKNEKAVRKVKDKIHSLTTEIVRSEKDIKSLGLEQKLSEVSQENYNNYRKAKFKHGMVDAGFVHFRNSFVPAMSILALIIGIIFIDRGALTLAAFMIIKTNSGSLSELIWNTGYIANAITDIRISCERMFALFDQKEFITERFGTKRLDNIVGNIEFKDVEYSFKEYEYPKHDGKKTDLKEPKLINENKVFDKISFKIEPHTTVAFVGKSGSGKSTILNLMSKMYEVDGGEVLIDGVNINYLDKTTLRNGISLVNQFPYIFDMTIKENLLLAKHDATDEDIYNALQQASLKEFIDTLPNKIDTKVGESGIKLSGGQKQRLAIARALLRQSNIIIFDESTSSLDNFAQEEVKKSIDNLKGKSTIVIVAHRLSTIKNADTIFFLDNGKIVDQGTFDQLFKRNSTFKAMFLAENI